MPLVVVPPAMLVKMFGVPELVRLPVKVGETTTFTAHSIEWKCKYIRRGVYYLGKADSRGQVHARWGRAAEIAEDIGHVLEHGSLPCSDKARCF